MNNTNYRKIIEKKADSMILKRDLDRALNVSSDIKRESFNVILFVLFMKADANNYEVLKTTFPEQALAFEKYKKFGIPTTDDDIFI
jgi:hypothetical protein